MKIEGQYEIDKPVLDAHIKLCPKCNKKLLTRAWGKGGAWWITNGMYNMECTNGHEFYQLLEVSQQ